MSATEILAGYLSEFDLVDAPDRVVHEAKRIALDTLGCLIAACDSEIAPLVYKAATLFGAGAGASMAGQEEKAGLLSAIYANGRLANALDLDETFPVGAHFGVGAVPTALGFAEAYGLSGREFLASVIAGYELGGRVASYIGPVVHVVDGRVTGFPDVWGVAAPVVMAAAAASGRARRLDPAHFAQAIGLAGSNTPLPAGSQWSGEIDLPNSKYCDAGWCSVTGAFGTLSAELGSTGFNKILDGPDSLARMYGVNTADERWLTEGLGTVWMLDDVTYKPWPTCRFTHYPLTALEQILRDHPIDIDAIEEIVVETAPLAASTRFTNPDPKTFAARQFSYPHMIAMRLLGVSPGPQWLSAEKVDDPSARAIKKKIRVEPHPRGDSFARTFSRNQIRTMPGGIRLRAQGRIYRAECDYALGDPWDEKTRYSDQDLFSKIRALNGRETADKLIGLVMDLEKLPQVGGLADVLTKTVKEVAHA